MNITSFAAQYGFDITESHGFYLLTRPIDGDSLTIDVWPDHTVIVSEYDYPAGRWIELDRFTYDSEDNLFGRLSRWTGSREDS
jgi:hypothetical protein